MVGVGGGFGWYCPQDRFPYFVTNSQAMRKLAATHLIERLYPARLLRLAGHENQRLVADPRRRLRIAGAESGAGVPYVHRPLWRSAALAVQCRRNSRPDCFVAQADRVDGLRQRAGPAFLEACRSLGVLVPEQVAVMGVDNDEVILS